MESHSIAGRLAFTAVMVGVLLMASCSTSPAPQATSASSTTATKPYGSLVIATTQTAFGSDSIVPGIGNGQAYNLTVPIFDSLIFLSPEAQFVPGIAERWEIASDGMSHTFYIRKGVKFHDGSDLSGADAKFSIERALKPENTNPDATNWRAWTTSVELKDDYTVVVRFKQANFELLKGIDVVSGAIVPKKYIEEKGEDYFKSHLVGSGPWKFVRWVPGDRLELEAVEDHWRTVPKFKNLTVLNVPEEGTRVAMLKTGEADVIELAVDSVATVKAAGLRVKSYDVGAHYFGYLFHDNVANSQNALADVRVRKAIQLAINQKEIADSLFSGFGGPQTLTFLSPKAYFFDPNVLKPDPYDPEGARKLLAEAGYPTGLNVKLWEQGGGGMLTTVNNALAGYWRKMGVNVEMAPIQPAALTPKFVPNVTPEMYNTIRTQIMSEPRDFESFVYYHSKKGPSKNHRNARLDELIDKVPTMPMSAEKTRLALEAAVLAASEYGTIEIVGVYNHLGLGSKVGDLNPGRWSSNKLPGQMFETISHAK